MRRYACAAAVLVVLSLCGCSGGGSARTALLTLTPDQAETAGQLSRSASLVRERFAAEGLDATITVRGGHLSVAVLPADLAMARRLVQPGFVSFRATWVDPSGQLADPATNPATNPATTPPPAPTPSAPTTGAVETKPSAAELAEFAALDCSTNGGRPPVVDDDPDHFVVACDRSGTVKYLLDPTDLTGSAVESAYATMGTATDGAATGMWEVDLTFQPSAVSTVAKVSARLLADDDAPLAIDVNGIVVSDPATDGVLGPDITISGGSPPLTQQDATRVAVALRLGALPSFTVTG